MPLETRPTLRAAVALALLAPLTHAQEPGADSPEVLFDSVREAALAQDWARFRLLIDRSTFQEELETLRKIIAESDDDRRREMLDLLGFRSAEELATADLETYLDRVLPGAYGDAFTRLFLTYDLVSIRPDGEDRIEASFEAIDRESAGEDATFVLLGRRRDGRWFLTGDEGISSAPAPVDDSPIELLAGHIKSETIRSFRLAAPGATHLTWRGPDESDVEFLLPREGETWVPADARGAPPAGEPVFQAGDGFAFKLKIERVTTASVDNLYLIVIYIYRDYDFGKAKRGRDDDLNLPAQVFSTMVAANFG